MHHYRVVFFPKQAYGIYSVLPAQQSAPACAHTCTQAAHLPLLQTSQATVSAPSYAQPGSFSPLSSNCLCPQSANSLLLFSAFPFWVFQEDKEHTSVNLMFLGCLIKRDKIAELRAGLAGVGSHALFSCCCFRLSCTSCFCPPCPQAWVLGPTGGSESGQSPATCCQQAAIHFLCSTSVSCADGSKGQLWPEGPEAYRVVKGPSALWRVPSPHSVHPACSSPPGPSNQPVDSEVNSKVYFFIGADS